MKFIQESLIVTVLFLILSLFFAASASAHTLKNENSFGLIVHVEPNDEPVARQKTDIRLLFTQTPSNFNPDQASGLVEIYRANQLIYRQDVFKENQSIDDIHFNFVFPDIGIYKIKVSGRPDLPGTFQPFSLEYDLRVEKSASNNIFSRYKQSSLLILFFVGLLIASAIIIFRYVKKGTN